ncbi:MAG: hypothetical protein J5822_04135 [Eubacteriaceae bacterium]|nr:hypothetical protein [Eubacteriaceae bacterium]
MNKKLKALAAVALAAVATLPYALAAFQVLRENLKAQKEVMEGMEKK